ncbi:hypothetical protein TNCV_1179141 [Trichonephila clavipes]|nr:hypothetical protein TNCV_1179141 [Trichonephila clavipes]
MGDSATATRGPRHHGRPTGGASTHLKRPQRSVRKVVIVSGPMLPGRTVKMMPKSCAVLGHFSTRTVKWESSIGPLKFDIGKAIGSVSMKFQSNSHRTRVGYPSSPCSLSGTICHPLLEDNPLQYGRQ